MNPQASLPKIILASTSPFRKQLMEKLHLPFSTAKPEVDETPLQGESVLEMIDRLSLAKAQAVAKQFSGQNALIIASDQTATFEDKPIGKPHTHENAVKQLQQFSGKAIEFHTGLVVLNAQNGTFQQTLETVKVHFRPLSEPMIENYLRLDQPYQCAGSIKSEGLGITLFEKIETDDPNTLIGLPLIRLTEFLNNAGIELPYRAES